MLDLELCFDGELAAVDDVFCLSVPEGCRCARSGEMCSGDRLLVIVPCGHPAGQAYHDASPPGRSCEEQGSAAFFR